MNQILETSIKKENKKRRFYIQFFISIFSAIIYLFFLVLNKIKFNNDLNKAQTFSNNYNVYRLYSENNIPSFNNNSDIIGTIIIPKLNIKYPFFNKCTDDLLKFSPCKLYGEMPYNKSNLCITGHNYNDNRFFGRINELTKNDKITITDNLKNEFNYFVYTKYEVDETDTSPLYSNNDSYYLTLITCNNSNKKRIIIKAILKA